MKNTWNGSLIVWRSVKENYEADIQQDGALCHIAKLKWLLDCAIDRAVPLNSTENLWDIINKWLC